MMVERTTGVQERTSMPDKRLEELVAASKSTHTQAAREAANEAFLRRVGEVGRSAARTDYEIWKRAIEARIGASSLSDVTVKYETVLGARIYGDKKTIFGGYKFSHYKLHGFKRICESKSDLFATIEAYKNGLQEMLGTTFTVSCDAGGMKTFRDYYAGVENPDGSTSSMYRNDYYEGDPHVTVRW
jgi:hypothetical protein